MPYFQQDASNKFPDANWTGGGSIHASIARNACVPISFTEKQVLLASMYRYEWPAYIARVINQNCPGMTWLLGEEDFQNLIMVDYSRFLNGKGALNTKGKLTNPMTGNKFHRITLVDEIWVGGVRVWIEACGAKETNIGFRFRLEALEKDAEDVTTADKAAANVRETVRTTLLEIEDEVMEIKDMVVKVPEEQLLVVEQHVNVG